MRPLKPEELDLVAGGAGSTITVTGQRPHTTTTSLYQRELTGGGSGGGGGSFGGGGSGGTGLVAGTFHTTKEGHVYKVNINLTAAQAAIVDQIVDYGKDHGYSDTDVDVAVADAYYESSFNNGITNGTHIGLYQYDQQTWSDLGETGSIYNLSDQIAAIYHDITKFDPRYTTAYANNTDGLRTDGLSFGQYFEIKHELGDSATNWESINQKTGQEYIVAWSNKDSSLGLTLQ